MKNRTFKYLASPYSHPDPEIRERRFKEICKIASVLIMGGNVLFCPISMSHPIQEYGHTKSTWEFWEAIDTKFLELSDELLVITMDGWEESIGVQAEIKIARDLGLPIRYLDPKTLEEPHE